MSEVNATSHGEVPVKAEEFVAVGKKVFMNSCTPCHGNKGEGVSAPAIVGAGSSLTTYGTAKKLLDYISETMPLDNPGGLSPQEYLSVTVYLLLENNLISATTPISPDNLASIRLVKQKSG